jgi:CheY-like chemotaxis protein
MRVLIVDDNADSAEMLSVLVQLHGHEARTVHDGLAAIRAYGEFKPHAALLDIGLPGLTGYDVAKRLRGTDGDACYLVAITGWGRDDDRRRARAAGFNCHVTKPIDPDAIVHLLGSISTGARCDACDKCLEPTPGDVAVGEGVSGNDADGGDDDLA